MESRTFIELLVNFLGNCGCIVFGYWLAKKKYTKRKTCYCLSNPPWVDILKCPIPEDIGDHYETDGEEVQHVYGIEYNKCGQVTMKYRRRLDGEDRLVTHWMPPPDLPTKMITDKSGENAKND